LPFPSAFYRDQTVYRGITMTSLSRRQFFASGGAALAAAGLLSSPAAAVWTTDGDPFPIPQVDLRKIPPEFRRTIVPYPEAEWPGTIIVDTDSRHLYLTLEGGQAIRYGVGVGRAGFEWSGLADIGYKEMWPRWNPPADMVARDPEAAKWKDGMPGGPNNPLGARALYLYQNGRDTLYRLHGTNAPHSIGKAMSSGCIRMLNQDVVELYRRAPVGTRVIVLGAGA
jgi:lipoprotein-anchoring transpeptidase ErfK/SrfK